MAQSDNITEFKLRHSLYQSMPTIRVTDKTWSELNRVAQEYVELKRNGFESILRISPDAIIQRLISDWDLNDKEEWVQIEREQMKGLSVKEQKAFKEMERKTVQEDFAKEREKIRKIQEKMYKPENEKDKVQ